MMGIKTGIGQGTSAFNKEIRLRIGAGIRLWIRVNQNK
jgi:predicted transporter